MTAEEVEQSAPSKFVIRKLPPQLSEDEFRKLLSSVCEDELEWFRFHQGSSEVTGDWTSTAYIKLKHPQLAPILKHILQNTVLTSKHGVHYTCEMEVALFQKVPKDKAKQDPYVGTYEEDPFYQQYLKEIEAQDEAASQGPTVTPTTPFEEESEQAEIITPLMQHIIDAHAPKPASRSKGVRGKRENREKDNHKKFAQAMPTISEKGPTSEQAGKSDSSSSKKNRERGKGKSQGSQKKAGPVNGTTNAKSSAASPNTQAGTDEVRNNKNPDQPQDHQAARIAVQAAAKAAAQLAFVSLDSTTTNASSVPVTNGKPAGTASKRNRSKGKGSSAKNSSASESGSSPCKLQDSAAGPVKPASGSAADRLAEAAAAAAAAAFGNAEASQGVKLAARAPRMRPALGARGVREALSRAGIKKALGVNGNSDPG